MYLLHSKTRDVNHFTFDIILRKISLKEKNGSTFDKYRFQPTPDI
jgi:hypothetical protein